MLCTRRKMPLPRVLKVLYLQVDFETDEISSWGSCESKTGPQTGVTDQGACSYSLLPALPLPPHPRCPHPGVPPPRCAPLSLGSWSPYPANQGRGLLMILLWFKNQFEFGKRNCDRQQDGGGAQGLNLRPGEPARMWLCCRACGGRPLPEGEFGARLAGSPWLSGPRCWLSSRDWELWAIYSHSSRSSDLKDPVQRLRCAGLLHAASLAGSSGARTECREGLGCRPPRPALALRLRTRPQALCPCSGQLFLCP